MTRNRLNTVNTEHTVTPAGYPATVTTTGDDVIGYRVQADALDNIRRLEAQVVWQVYDQAQLKAARTAALANVDHLLEHGMPGTHHGRTTGVQPLDEGAPFLPLPLPADEGA